MIGIIDYGMGNIHSVNKALIDLGVKTLVTNKPGDLEKCDKLVLPGVGAFKDAMQELEQRGLVEAIKEYLKEKRVFLGICLGMQLLLEASEEAKGVKGLGVIKGEVKKFTPLEKARRNAPFLTGQGLKVPHMGWNQLIKSQIPNPKSQILKDIADGAYVYFCHSYYCVPSDKNDLAATTEYGRGFASVIQRDNVYGMQFHPEKSQDVGLKILHNFIKLE